MSQFKKKITAFTAMLAFLSFSGAAMAVTEADMIGKTGNVGISGNNVKLDIDITSKVNGDVGQVDWNNFNVPGTQQVNFGFSGLSQTIINRVLGGQESEILGKLTNSCVGGGACTSFAATSKVILINPSGIMFGQGSSVDLNSFTASTFDFTGAKNLKGMSESDLANYQSGVLNKLSPIAKVNGEGRNYGDIKFDSNYTDAFEKAGIELKPGETQIVLDGTTFAHFNQDGSFADANPNKSIAIVSDNIKYKDSLIRTGENHNYVTPNNAYSNSNVRLITADGVTFTYLANGYVDGYKVAADTKNVERKIEIDNSGLAANETSIKAGSVDIVNQSANKNSGIKISNSVIKATKLINDENGNIFISATGDVNVDNARLETENTTIADKNTREDNGGEVYIESGKNITIKDSLIHTAGAIDGTKAGANAGAIRIYANDKVTINNTKAVAQGNADIQGIGSVDVNSSLIKADNALTANSTKNVNITSKGDIKSNNSIIIATGDVDIRSVDGNGTLQGDVILSGDLKDGKNQSLILAGDKLSIQATDTKVDNVGLAYGEIKFYNDGTQGTNNVTIANNTTFTPIVNGALSKDVNLETNGNLTFDNATAKIAGYNFNFKRDDAGNIIDDGTPGAYEYNLTFSTGKADNINAKSTQGNVNAINGSNIATNKNITLTSDNKNVNVNNSTLKGTSENVNLTASKGSVNIKDGSNIIAGKDVNVTAYETITFGAQGAANVNIDNSSNLTAGEDMNIVSLAGDINGEKTTMPTLTYGDRLTFNAAGNNNFTSEDSLKAVNVDFIAGKANNFTTKGDIQFVNSSLEAKNNNITTTQEGGDVIMNNLTIKSATANPKDTVTKISAKGNVTTKDVTGTASSDVAAAAKTFPQSVDFDGSVTDKTTPDTVLDINQTKLIVETKVNKTTPKNNDNGSITLTVKNADNAHAGLDLTAQNDSWDEQIDKGEGPEVHLNAADNKVAITNIYTDKLTLDKNDAFIAGKDTKDGSMPTITVKDQGGFNMDPNLGYDPEPDGFDYGKHTDREQSSETVRIWDEEKGEYVISKTDNETVYGKDYVDRTTTTTIDREHEITFGDNGEEQFKLVYEKKDVQVEDTPGTVTRVESICPELPEIEPEEDEIDSFINIIKLPKEQVEISKTSKVSDNTVDQTSSIMSAAAKVDLDAAAEATYTNDDEEEK
ncbi:MAG: filamentous hemagglutinin N-terminal domain-containing protein [Candidatus Gastranaerophilales bacterium]|nr:filamentous hemagglutinin N-terminal domain-containing protein [Candidatus Gastranaerophilales bacterium]